MPKTQSALLEAMAERQVTVDGDTRRAPEPFLAARDREPDRARGHVPASGGAARPLLPRRRALGYPDEDEELGSSATSGAGTRSTGSSPSSASPSSQQLEAAVAAVYVDDLLAPLDRRARPRRPVSCRRSRSARRCAAASRSSAPPAPGRSSTGATTSRPRGRRAAVPPVLGHRIVFTPALHRRGARPVEDEPRSRSSARCTELAPPPELVGRRPPSGAPDELSLPARPAAAARRVGLREAAERAARTRLRRRGHAAVPPGRRPGQIDWKRLGAAVVGRGERRVRRPGAISPTRRRGSVVRRRPRPVDGALPRRPALAVEAGGAADGRSAVVGGIGAGARPGGYLDTASTGSGWLPPRASRGFDAVEERLEHVGFDGAGRRNRRRVRPVDPEPPLGAGGDVHVRLSPTSSTRRRRRPGCGRSAHRWDVVPVVVQDPVWEQSFPRVDGLVVPFADPATGRLLKTRVSRREALRRREANEARLAAQLDEFRSLGLDFVVLGDVELRTVQRAFIDWGEARVANRRGAWR